MIGGSWIVGAAAGALGIVGFALVSGDAVAPFLGGFDLSEGAYTRVNGGEFVAIPGSGSESALEPSTLVLFGTGLAGLLGLSIRPGRVTRTRRRFGRR